MPGAPVKASNLDWIYRIFYKIAKKAVLEK
jgi:hypothetical protein